MLFLFLLLNFFFFKKKKVSRATTVTSVRETFVNEASPPRFRAMNVDIVEVDNPVACDGGVLADKVCAAPMLSSLSGRSVGWQCPSTLEQLFVPRSQLPQYRVFRWHRHQDDPARPRAVAGRQGAQPTIHAFRICTQKHL